MKIGILTGTRPDIIKMAPLYWEAKRRRHKPVLIHVAQHYPFHLYEGVYCDLNLPFPPDFEVGMSAIKKIGVHASKVAYHTDSALGVGLTKKLEKIAGTLTERRPNPAAIVGNAMIGLTELFRKELSDLDILLTHGDTLTCMAGSLAASLNLIPTGHVEAGLRTFSKEPFPEQIDTRTSDACSDLYFAATKTNKRNLQNEGFPKQRIFTVGNTVVDAAVWASKKGRKSKKFFESRGINFSKKIVYASCHRRENMMHEKRFKAIFHALRETSKKGFQVLWSIRPGTQNAINKYNLEDKIEK
ncbi:MAG: UDP-N-acetyl glucosamine 2-epimerase, partial [Candidatus Micrarchaeia archaeon]